MSIVFPTNNLSAVGSSLPDQAIDASEFARVEPLVTPEELVGSYLFGIPLVSSTPDPITRKPAIMTGELLKQQIRRAVSRLELELSINIFPVQHEVRRGFDRNEYLRFGYLQLPHRPILSVQKLSIVTPTGQDMYIVPNEWIAPGHLQRGQLSLVPLQAAFVGSGQVASQDGNGVAFLSILGSQGWVPEYWRCQYVTGFDEGKIPRVINDLIAIETAMEVLSLLQTTASVQSHSIGVDGLSQSVATAGPQKYQPRIEFLKEAKAAIVAKCRALFLGKMFSTSI